MTVSSMTNDRVLELIAAFGAEPMGWPEDERDAAKARLLSDPETFAGPLADARALDEYLAREIVPEPSSALTDVILAQAPTTAFEPTGLLRRLSSLMFPQGARWPAGAALASLAMGLVGGYAYASTGIGYDQVDSAYSSAFGFDSSESWVSLE